MRSIAQGRGLVIACQCRPCLYEQCLRPLQETAAVRVHGQLLVDGRDFILQTLGASVAGVSCNAGPLRSGSSLDDAQLTPEALGSGACIGEALSERQERRFREPAFQIDWLCELASRHHPCRLCGFGSMTGLFRFLPPVDHSQEIFFGGSIPTQEKALQCAIHSLNLSQSLSMPNSGPLETFFNLQVAASGKRLGIQSLAQLVEMVEGRRIGQQIALHQQLVNALAERV